MFAAIPEIKSVKTSFVSISEGNPVMLQIISPQAERFYVHNIKTSDGKFVKVEHTPDCNICRNAELRERYKPYYTFRAAVLNVTPVVRCPKCGTAYSTISSRRAPERCPQDGEDLTKVAATPLNEVQILEAGVTVFKSLNAVIDTIKATMNSFDLSKLVLLFTASGSGLKKVTTIIPRVDIPGQACTSDLPDLALIKYSEAEVGQILSGMPLSKIFEMRRATTNTAAPVASGGLDFASLGFADLPGI